jgi:hypothetical protein
MKERFSEGGRILLLGMLMLSSLALTGCWPIKPDPVIVMPESQVQKMLKGESANFDGYLMTTGAVTKLLERAEQCKERK